MSVGTKVCENRDSRKKYIFLLDGDSIINFINRKLFQSLNSQLNVIESHNPKSALDFLFSEQDQPDLILVDIHLPFMSGWEFMEKCKELNIKSKFFLLSTNLTSAEINRAKLNPQVIGFSEKPLLSDGIEHIFSCLEERLN